ncbi:MAG: creatininase family protein [Thermodesulfobacteriota bacterium]
MNRQILPGTDFLRSLQVLDRLEVGPVSVEAKRLTIPLRLLQTSRARHAVSSSGGKESLLTYGLLQELGIETHPLFVNESGRHWFTALNAYRHFKDRVPHTSRVWVNSDRVFSWVLQHLPFIRKNFKAIRSDEYPIRLWTVAIFLFGILPLLRKREIGRLLIGDEYDTTVTTRSYGISHYHGLFDQSLDFDTALSRYFLQKGWTVSQFSILRPLSEMLIEKILAHRYPHLLALQTSGRAHPEVLSLRIHPRRSPFHAVPVDLRDPLIRLFQEHTQGTVSIQNDTLARMVYEIGMALARQGIRKLIIINGHGGNIPALNYAAQMVHRDAHIFVCAETGESSDVDIEDLVKTPNDVHAGEIETSTALAVRPHLVHMEKARAAVPRFSSRYLDFTSRRSISWYASTRRLSPSGILGDPTRASAENGRRMWEIMISHLVSLVEDLKHMTLDEIHHPQGARSP